MREILFKAKRLDNGKWVEGSLISTEDNSGFILRSKTKAFVPKGTNTFCSTECYEIDQTTICQFTGLTDKNDKKIWENDIAHIRSSGLSGYGVIKYENGNLVLVDAKRKRTYSMYGEWKIRKDGNIFDNGDLLEVE